MTTSELLAIKSFNRYPYLDNFSSIIPPPRKRGDSESLFLSTTRVEQNYCFSRQGESNVLLASVSLIIIGLPGGICATLRN